MTYPSEIGAIELSAEIRASMLIAAAEVAVATEPDNQVAAEELARWLYLAAQWSERVRIATELEINARVNRIRNLSAEDAYSIALSRRLR